MAVRSQTSHLSSRADQRAVLVKSVEKVVEQLDRERAVS
jgi:hypothetical protein